MIIFPQLFLFWIKPTRNLCPPCVLSFMNISRVYFLDSEHVFSCPWYGCGNEMVQHIPLTPPDTSILHSLCRIKRVCSGASLALRSLLIGEGKGMWHIFWRGSVIEWARTKYMRYPETGEHPRHFCRIRRGAALLSMFPQVVNYIFPSTSYMFFGELPADQLLILIIREIFTLEAGSQFTHWSPSPPTSCTKEHTYISVSLSLSKELTFIHYDTPKVGIIYTYFLKVQEK